jgi:colicin import membrane protein
MAEQKESSVLFSLKELMSIEENRIKEEEDAKKKRAEQEIQAKVEAERRMRDEEEGRLKAEEERRRSDDLRRRMEEAQVEAAKAAEIEKRKLEDQHRLQMEALAKQQAHEKEVHIIQSQKRKGIPPAIIAAIAIVLLGAIGAVVFFVAIKPSNEAKEEVATAAKLAEEKYTLTDDSTPNWDEAEKHLAIARDKDKTNKDIVTVSDKVKKKRDEWKEGRDKVAREKEEADKKLLADLQKKLSAAGTSEDEKKALEEQLKKLQEKKPGGYTGGPAVAGPKKVCKEVPGCPLCPPVCN